MEQAAVDWAKAMRTGATLVPPGPELDAREIAAVVDDLRRAADRAVELVAEVTGDLGGPASSVTLVVDRPGWLAAAASSANAMLSRAGVLDEPTSWGQKLRARSLGSQAGAVLAVVATRILGQFDPFADPSRLLLVAPNVVALERKLGVLPRDFRLWVCLHEQTHSFQFGAAPWLRDHLTGLIAEVVADEEPEDRRPRLGIDGLLSGAGQRAAFDRATAVMSLMEGHADVMMDRVPLTAVPTLASIRAIFEQHRDQGGFSGLVSRMFGLNLKREQYRDGATFCKAVIAEAGVPTLNRAFESAENLPSLAEIHDPQLWLRRL